MKAPVFEKRPFARIHSILTSQGFTKIGWNQSIKYRVKLRDCSTESIYWLEIPVDQYPQEPNQAKLGKPSLLGEERIPQSIREATASKLYEIADYLKSPMEEKESHSLNQTDHNGSMAQNEEEIKRLGKEMESMQTHTELYENGWIPNPIQYEDKK
ncbi:hypothetical protein OH784_29160 [Ectobacillus funiculus]|uniref:hypothetical protein n=2 Tax=Ectobacillus funiculus TaxID=137993 RepID=UPI00397AABAF